MSFPDRFYKNFMARKCLELCNITKLPLIFRQLFEYIFLSITNSNKWDAISLLRKLSNDVHDW